MGRYHFVFPCIQQFPRSFAAGVLRRLARNQPSPAQRKLFQQLHDPLCLIEDGEEPTTFKRN